MVSSSSFPRLFTVNEANALLPSVRPLIDKILENIRRLKSKSETVIRNERLDPEAPNLMDRLREDEEIARLLEQVKGWVEEIHSYGCICKGIEQGLIDFPACSGRRSCSSVGSLVKPASATGTASRMALPAGERCSTARNPTLTAILLITKFQPCNR